MFKTNYWTILAGILTFAIADGALAGAMGDQNQNEADEISWRGLYAGGQLGGAWSHQEWQFVNPNYFNTLGSQLLGSNFGFNTSNLLVGGYFGFNYQTTTPWLLGIEGSISSEKLDSNKPSPFFPSDHYASGTNEMGTLRGRLGYIYNRWLPYLSGGWAFANTSVTLTDAIGNVQALARPWNSGWIIGLGVEYRYNLNVSMGIAYDYSAINFKNQSTSCPMCSTGLGFGTPLLNGNFKTQAVMARVSYLINQ